MTALVRPTVDLRCGDALEVMRGMAGESVDAVVTDPPYGTGGHKVVRRNGRAVHRPSMERKDWDVWDAAWIDPAARLLKPQGRLATFCPITKTGEVIAAVERHGFPLLTHVVWEKPDPALAFPGRLALATEFVLVFGRGRLNVAKHEPNVWRGSAVKNGRDKQPFQTTIHPYQKPLGLLRWIVRLVAPPGGLVVDPFCGSGTTLIAAVMQGTSAIGVDNDAAYVAMAARRVAPYVAQTRLPLEATP